MRGNAGAAEPVYDIINAGPRQRFRTAGNLPHNCLAGGYGAGFRKFINMLARYGIDPDVVFCDPVTPADEQALRDWLLGAKMHEPLKEFDEFCKKAGGEGDAAAEALKMRRWWINSWKQIMNYRATNPLIVTLWRNMGTCITMSAQHGEDFSVTLPGGRKIVYFKPFVRDGETWAWQVRGEHPERVYGGLITENLTQALARDVFENRKLALLDAGIAVLWTIYDEYVTEIPDDMARDPAQLERIKKLVSTSPEWAPQLPVAVDQVVSEHYTK